jgi:hypothetical protein
MAQPDALVTAGNTVIVLERDIRVITYDFFRTFDLSWS